MTDIYERGREMLDGRPLPPHNTTPEMWLWLRAALRDYVGLPYTDHVGKLLDLAERRAALRGSDVVATTDILAALASGHLNESLGQQVLNLALIEGAKIDEIGERCRAFGETDGKNLPLSPDTETSDEWREEQRSSWCTGMSRLRALGDGDMLVRRALIRLLDGVLDGDAKTTAEARKMIGNLRRELDQTSP